MRPESLVPSTIATLVTENELLREFAAAAERVIVPLLRRASDELYIDDADRLKALGVLLTKAWTDGAASGRKNETVAEAIDSDIEIDDSALAAALADEVRPRISV